MAFLFGVVGINPNQKGEIVKMKTFLFASIVFLTVRANAAINFDTNAIAVFNVVGAGTYYQYLGPPNTVSGEWIAAGGGFDIDISAPIAALGGTIESFAIFALLEGDGIGGEEDYNSAESIYVDTGAGLVLTGSDATPLTNSALQNEISNIEFVLSQANLGLNYEGSSGDFDSYSSVSSYLTVYSPTDLVRHRWQAGSASTTDSTLLGDYPTFTDSEDPFGKPLAGIYIEGHSFYQPAAVVPVPTTAWLFGSALFGLAGMRTQKN